MQIVSLVNIMFRNYIVTILEANRTLAEETIQGKEVIREKMLLPAV